MSGNITRYLIIIPILLIIALSIMPPVVLAQLNGPPSNRIIYDVVTKIEDGILMVVEGDADIFFWPVSGADIEALGLTPEQMQNVRLVPQTTSLDALLFNPYVDNSELGKYGVATSVTDNVTHFNPFGLRKFRFAMNYLISRKYIVEEIMYGSANPQYTVIGPSHPAYPQIEQAITDLGLTPEGDTAKAMELIDEVFSFCQSGLQAHGYDLYKKEDASAPAGYWWTFKRPDGSEEVVTINFLIRVEDERREIGDYVANLLEQIGIKVNRVYIERGQVFKLVYGADPRTLDWHIYTEGWVSTAESPWVEWDIAWYYAGWYYGLLPTWANLYWAYTPELEKSLWNETIQEFIETESLKLVQGVYTGDEYWNIAKELIKAGIEEGHRVFLTENVQFFVVNKRVENLVPGRSTGLYSPFVFRTATTLDKTIKVVQYSAQAALFMSAWNPVGGMTDIYSTNIWRYVHEYGGYWHPTTGEYVPMGAKWQVLYDVPVNPSNLYVYKAGWMTLSDYLAQYPDDWRVNVTTATVKIVYNYYPSAYHDGEDFNIWDILFDIAWTWEWAQNDTDVRGEDPWYHPNIESSMQPVFGTLIGIEVINETAIAIYGTYKHPVSEGETAGYYMFYNTWSPAIWMAMEYCVINGGPVSGASYGWYEGEAERYIDAFDSAHLVDIRAALDTIVAGGYIPPYLASTNDLATEFGLPVKDISDAASMARTFIDNYGHGVISNGPFYISVYLPAELHLELTAFRDTRYPFREDYWQVNLPYKVLELKGVEIARTMYAPGESINLTVTVVDHMLTPQDQELPPEDIWVEASLLSPTGAEIYSVEATRIGDYTWYIEIPGDVTQGLGDGDYTVLVKIGRFKGIPELTTEITVTIFRLITEVQKIGTQLNETITKIGELSKTMNESIAAIRQELLAQLGEVASGLADAMDQLSATLSAGLANVTSTLEDAVAPVAQGVDDLKTTVGDIQSDVGSIKTTVSDLKTTTDGIDSTTKDLASKLDGLAGAVSTVQILVIIAVILSLISIALPFVKKS